MPYARAGPSRMVPAWEAKGTPLYYALTEAFSQDFGGVLSGGGSVTSRVPVESNTEVSRVPAVSWGVLKPESKDRPIFDARRVNSTEQGGSRKGSVETLSLWCNPGQSTPTLQRAGRGLSRRLT